MSDSQANVLRQIVEDDALQLAALEDTLLEAGHLVRTAEMPRLHLQTLRRSAEIKGLVTAVLQRSPF